MPVIPEIDALLTAQKNDPTFARPGTDPLTIPEARALHEADAVSFTPTAFRDEVGRIRAVDIPSRRGTVRGHVYQPTDGATVGTLLWFHGGGWVTGSLDTADIAARAFCARAGVTVVTVDYALAPEHPWPAAYEDGIDALNWAATALSELGARAPLLIGGDSAGGNIAAAVALTQARRLAGQVLVYPVIDLDSPQASYPSRTDNGTGYYVAWADIEWAVDRYVPDPRDRAHPTASPLRSADLTDAPPAVIVAVEYDTLLDEDRAYAARLESAGVDVELLEFAGLVHGGFDMIGLAPAADAAMSTIAARVRALAERNHDAA